MPKPPNSPPHKPKGRPPFRGGPKGKPQGGPRAQPARPLDPDGLVRLFGTHAVEAALSNPKRRIKRLLATENAERRIETILATRSVEIDRATPTDLDRLLGADTVHQGLMLEAEPLIEPTLEDLMEAAISTGAPLVLLDHVTDPHNAGAVLRSAAAFGASGLIMTQRHSPPLNGVLAKSASGALDLIPVLLVQNLARTMDEIKAQKILLVGLEGEAEARLEDQDFKRPTALVLGAEGKGLRELTAETCDVLVRVSTSSALGSLNVSNAAAIALHWALMSRSR